MMQQFDWFEEDNSSPPEAEKRNQISPWKICLIYIKCCFLVNFVGLLKVLFQSRMLDDGQSINISYYSFVVES